MKSAAVLVLGLAIVLVPVAVRNSIVAGGFYVTTAQFGPNLYLGNNRYADGTAQSLRVGRGSAEYERQDATELAEHALGRQLTPAEVSQYWADRAFGFIMAEPGAWLKLMWRKFALLWNATEMLDTESQESYGDWSVVVRLGALVGHFGVLVPLALLGVWTTWTDRRRLWVLYLMVAAYAGSVLLFFVYARYRFPLVPFLVLFAAAGITTLISLAKSRSISSVGDGPGTRPPARAYDDASRQTTRHGRRRLPVGASAANHIREPFLLAFIIIVTAVFANWPVLSPSLMRAITEHNLGAALQSDGRVDEAIDHYRRALVVKPDHAPALNNLGTALAAQGDVVHAIENYERALAIAPDYASAHYNLGNAFVKTGQTDKAVEHLRQALQWAPGSAEVHSNLGIALMEEGRFEEAIGEFRQALEYDPKSATTHRSLGNALASAGRSVDGVDALRRAVQLDPRDGPAHYDLATLLVETQQIFEAVEEFRVALALMPESVEVLNNLGIALGSVGRLDEAIAMFRRALSFQPEFAPAKANLAAALQQQRQLTGYRR